MSNGAKASKTAAPQTYTHTHIHTHSHSLSHTQVHQVAAFLSNGAKASKTAAPTVKAKLAYGVRLLGRGGEDG